MNKESVLVSMGYRKLSGNVYAKPVGFNLFTFEMAELRWTNFFMGSDGATKQIWNSNVYESDETVKDDFLRHIKNTEARTRLIKAESELHFLSLEEKISLIL